MPVQPMALNLIRPAHFAAQAAPYAAPIRFAAEGPPQDTLEKSYPRIQAEVVATYLKTSEEFAPHKPNASITVVIPPDVAHRYGIKRRHTLAIESSSWHRFHTHQTIELVLIPKKAKVGARTYYVPTVDESNPTGRGQ